MSVKRRVVLLGATGRLGRIVAPRLAADPRIELVMQSRTAQSNHVTWSVQDGEEALGDVFSGAHTVLNLAGQTPPASPMCFEAANVDLALSVQRAAKAAGVAHTFMASSAAVPAPSQDLIDETAPAVGATPYGLSKAEMERRLLLDPEGLTILRIGNVAGADALLGQLQQNGTSQHLVVDQFPDKSTPLRSYIGPRTFGNVLADLICHPGPVPHVLNIAQSPAVEMHELLRAWSRMRPGTMSWTLRAAPDDAVRTVVLATAKLAKLVDLPSARPDAIVQEVIATCR